MAELSEPQEQTVQANDGPRTFNEMSEKELIQRIVIACERTSASSERTSANVAFFFWMTCISAIISAIFWTCFLV